MKPKLMQRGRTQTLFTFLPGKTFDYEGGRSICRVTTFEYEENQRINKEWVLADLRKYLRAWQEPEGRPAWLQFFPDPQKYKDSYVLAEPTKVLCEVFPLAFECRKCGRMVVYHSPDQAAGKGLTCGVCGGTLQQIYHVQVHTCGHIQPLTPPTCPKHGRNHIMLDDRGSQVYANFCWVCRACGDRELTESLTVDCPQCSGNPNMPKDQRRMRPAVHRAGSTFYPHVRTLVNLPDATLNQFLQDQEYRWLMVAAYLGFVEPDRLLDLARGRGAAVWISTWPPWRR